VNSLYLRMTRLFLGAAINVVTMQLILAGSAFGQTWIAEDGDWFNTSNSDTHIVPNDLSETATFNAKPDKSSPVTGIC
jgi:hypothetical protein